MPIARTAAALGLAAALLLTTGCGVIYSQQNFGSPRYRQVSVGAQKADVFANMGTPNAIYKAPNGEVFIYKFVRGKNILGIHSKIKRIDTVVVMDDAGVVQFSGDVEVGTGYTWLSGPVLDATHPVRTKELLFDPENYEYNYQLGG